MSTAGNRPMLDRIWQHWIPRVQIEVARAPERAVGISVQLCPPEGLTFTAHERVRRPDFNDVLIETQVNDGDPEAGWALVPRTTLVLLAWQATGRVLLLPGRELPLAVQANLDGWRRRYGTKSRNMTHGYVSKLVPLPTSVLLSAVDDAWGARPCTTCGCSRRWSQVRGGSWPIACAACRPEAPGVEWRLEAVVGERA